MYNLENEKRKLCEEIGSFFGGYFEENGQLCIDNGDEVFRYDTADELLIDWVDTLIESHREYLSYGTPGFNWEKEVLFIYSSVIGKRPVGLRKIDQKNGPVWQVSVDLQNPNFPHGKSVYIGTYNSIIDGIWARKTFLEHDIARIDTTTQEGLEAAIAKAKERRLQAKAEKREICNTQSFAVVCTYLINNDVAVYLFSNEDEASDFLKTCFDDAVKGYADDMACSTESYITQNRQFAKITAHYDGYDDITEYRIGKVYQ